ncbi:MAG: TonB-dependent receptor [Longimicrobiales bacterium]|nr:TonB-dependent receptor [Longimicrobiales bacterium]
MALWAALGVQPLSAQDEPALPSGSAVVTGQVVVGDTGQPLPTVSVELLYASDSVQIGSSVADEEGRFTIPRLPEGTFFVRLTSIGYGTVTTEAFEVAAAEVRDLGRLAMPVEAVEMEPITVSAERTAVTYEADRTTYNVGVMPGTEGTSVTETLATIPELEVDIDGRVTLRNSPVRIYIDDREAPMDGEALALFLEQFPSDYIAQIEVIDNPSARYDADGSGGIVNLVTKEGVELGLSGSVFANAGSRGEYGVGGRGTMQRGPWTVNGGGFGRFSDSEESGFDLRQNLYVDPAFLRQSSWTGRSGLTGDLDFEVRYDPTEDTRIFVESRVSGTERDTEGLTTTTHLSDLESPILAFDRSRASDSRRVSFDAAAGFEWESESESEDELEIEVELERGTQWQNSREEILEGLTETERDLLIPAELTLEDEDELETEWAMEVDYTRTFGGSTEVEMGYELEHASTENDRLIRLVEDPGAAPDGELEDRGHDNREVGHSAYGTVEQDMGDLSVEVGLRAEYTDLRFRLPEGTRFGQDWFNLFPSASASWRVSDDVSLRLSYSRRVDRPGMSELNPVNRSTDPLYRRVGNPDIEPEFSHTLSGHARWSVGRGHLRLSPYYRATTNGWARITTVDENGVSTRTYENLASSEAFGASLTYSLRQRDGRWGGHVSVSAARENRDASNLDERYSGSALRLSSRANVDARLTGSLSAEANLRYSPPRDLPQGRVLARYRADFGMRYRMLENRMSLRLRLRDPFGLERSESRLRDLDYIILGRSRPSTRSFEVSVSYALGGGGEYRGRRRWR